MNTASLSMIALLALGCLSGCEKLGSPVVKRAVLSVDQSVEATNKFGRVKISYISPTKRKYEWDGRSKTINMIARHEPFQGRLGLYEPAGSFQLNPFEIRLVVQESGLDFGTEEQIYVFLKQSSAVMDWVYTDDGLVVGFARVPARKQLNIDLWQIFLKGAKPTHLVGARSDQIAVTTASKH